MAVNVMQRIRYLQWYLSLMTDNNADPAIQQEFVAWWNSLAGAKQDELIALIRTRWNAVQDAAIASATGAKI